MLELRNIHKSFGDVRVLNGVNLRLEKGFVYALKGGNGSGKTTLLNIISGFLMPTEGVVEFKRKKIAKFAPYRVNRLGIGRTFQDLRLATHMTVYENMLLALETKQFAYPTKEQEKRADEILENVSLTEKLILLDEPFAGVDAENSEILRNCIVNLNGKEVTFIIVEHKQQLLDSIVNKVVELELGMVKK